MSSFTSCTKLGVSHDLEVHQFHTENALPETNSTTRLDTWWASVLASGKYHTFLQIVSALMSCFHGPQIEGSFSIMSNVMTTATSSMNVSTFSSIQTVKYALMSIEKVLYDTSARMISYMIQSAESCFQISKVHLEHILLSLRKNKWLNKTKR